MTLLTPELALIDLALAEDLAFGDITTDPLFSPESQCRAQVAVRQAGVVSGLTAAQTVFEKVDPLVKVCLRVQDGDRVEKGTVLLSLDGPTASVLKAERLALNLLQHLSGIATLTAQYVEALAGTEAKITHTRKTIPGLRSWAIQAVLHGGGMPHRKSLSHAVLIKDNHIQAAGSIATAVATIRKTVGHTVRIEVECDTLAQVREALEAQVDVILLDNMDLETLALAVKAIDGQAITEASGGVTLATVRAIAETGVDVISTSQITLSAPALDIGLDFLP